MPVNLATYQGVDLLSADERNEFRGAMMDIKATFHNTPVLYRVAGTTFSRFNEDRKNDTNFTDYNLMAYVEYSQLVKDEYVWVPQGADIESRIRVAFNSDYLDQQGLWDSSNNTCKFNGVKDELFISGKQYRITEIPVYDGMMDAKSIHVLIYAEPIIIPTK